MDNNRMPRKKGADPREETMTMHATRRDFLIGTGLIAAAAPFSAWAQDKPKLRFSAVFSEQDIRAEMMKTFADAIKDDFVFEGYYGGTLFKQGTELVALQRDNLEMGNIAPQDISKQVPAWSVVTSAYLFRDAAHLRKFFNSEPGMELKKLAEDQLGIHILGPTYFGTRQVGLKPTTKINTPADMAGIKLRMPNGDAWQFLGTSLGANPVPMAYAEVYTGLQTGAIDGQDNPLPNVENMKFYEVMSQIVLTSHLIGFDLLCVTNKAWNAMTPAKQAAFKPPPTRRSVEHG
jgi:TRAP-type C4-dicarboxylate transport system substrate-binding protein